MSHCGSYVGPVAMRKINLVAFHAHAQLVNKITTSEMYVG